MSSCGKPPFSIVIGLFSLLIVPAAFITFPADLLATPEQSLSQAEALNRKVVELYHAGRFEEAVPVAIEALQIRTRLLGSDHPDTLQSLGNLALLYKVMGDYAQAEPLMKRAAELKEQKLGRSHPDTLSSLNNLALLYQSMGKYELAFPLLTRVVEARKKNSGPDHPDTTRALNNLALLYQETGSYDKAEQLFQAAIEASSKSLGEEHPDTLVLLTNLAELYRETGEFDKAEPLLTRTLEVRKRVLGPDHPDVAYTLNSLSLLYEDTGNYAKAVSLQKLALKLTEKTRGPEHPQTALSLGNLAEMYWQMGDFEQAEPLLLRAVAINEKKLGDDHPQTGLSIQNLAAFYDDTGNFEKAMPLYTKALKIWEKSLGAEHPRLALLLTNLGISAAGHRLYEQAESFYQRALEIRKKALGDDHPDTLSVQANLASLYRDQGKYTKSEIVAKRVLASRKKVLGPNHPDTAASLKTLAFLYGSRNRPEKSLSLFRQAIAIEDSMIRNVFSVTSERQKLAFIQNVGDTYQAALSLIHSRMSDNRDAVRSGLDMVLDRKGVVFDAQARQQEAILRALDSETSLLWRELSRKRAILAKLLQSAPGKLPPELSRRRIDELQSGIAQLESELSSKSPLVAQEQDQRSATSAEVGAHLRKGSVLAEFVHIRDFDWDKGEWTNSYRYLVFVLHPDQSIELVDMGDAEPLDQRLNDSLIALKDAHSGIKRQLKAAERLYAALWAPLAKAVDGAESVVISPDGQLNLAPFDAVRDRSGKFLIEKMLISYVTSGRELLAGGAAIKPESALYLAANPTFDLSDNVARNRSSEFRGEIRSRGFKREFAPLPGTKTELFAIPELIRGEKKQVVTGKDATEASVLSARRPNVLHLATHGFFLEDQPPLPDSIGSVKQEKTSLPADYENPLVRSGLALAGANHATETESSLDGLLTALEVSGMDLHGTDLVTLSACETGVGKVRAGEGVFGLRRAFALAGARHLLMSLWPVADAITAQQMQSFYRFYGQGERPAVALRKAQLETIGTLRKRYGSAPPSLWAPFILQGSPGSNRSAEGRRQ